MKSPLILLALVILATLAACSGNNQSKTGIGEPLVIKVTTPSQTTVLAQFISGSLPGTMPSNAPAGTGGGTSLDADASTPKLPQVTFQYSEPFVREGQANIAIGGLTSSDVSAVALAWADGGTGYWVVPVGPFDGATQQPTWTATADFGASIPPGFHNLNYVAINGQGQAGIIQSQKICISGSIPNYYPGCASIPPPAAVIALSWDTNVDLDLQVQAPDGTFIDSKNPVSVVLDAGATTIPYDAARMDRDSNGYCVIDGIRVENLIWQKVAPKGQYGIYVNLFDACKQPVVHFNVQVYTSVDVVSADGGTTKDLRSWYSANGILLDFQANGGSNRGLFVSEFNFQ